MPSVSELNMQARNCVDGVAGWSAGPHYPFVVYGKGPGDNVRWHVLGPGFDTARFSNGFKDNRDAEALALHKAKLRLAARSH